MAKGSRFGGRAARSGAGPLWKFTARNDGSFTVPDPQYVSGLYFPLCNAAGMKCSVTPELKGDVCTEFANYLTIPIVTEDLHRSNASRNFWVGVGRAEPWSATGVSASAAARQWGPPEPVELEAGIGWFQVRRTNRRLGLEATTTVFVPAADNTVEIMRVEITNVGQEAVTFTPTVASPLFGRTADNLRDHRQVTTLFNEVRRHKHGVWVRPRISHDEAGHRPNTTRYAVLAWTDRGGAPREIWASLRDFCGEGGSLANPEAVFKSLPAPRRTPTETDGHEAVGAMRFAPVTLRPGRSAGYVVVHGITEEAADLDAWARRYGSAAKVARSLAATRKHWQRIANSVEFHTPDSDLNNWLKWVAAQLVYRKTYGNSYLPDYGYGRGGRGWRDLWQDLLSLFLVDPAGSREEIVNNFRGVRVDGTNATIVGTAPGEFKADRNDIPRVWCDHAAWPFFVLNSYLDQTGDFRLLLAELPYWKDHLAVRCRQRDGLWDRRQGHQQRTAAGRPYRGTILEHVLLELLSSFFHVGAHNNVLLEGGDWNDTYDSARHKGESVCFTSVYAGDLRSLADLLDRLAADGLASVELLEEMLPLLDRLPGQSPVAYRSPKARRRRLGEYFAAVAHTVSGRRGKVPARHLAADLRAKADFLGDHIRHNEWITTADGLSFFNGHYDDHGRRVHGDHANGVRMDLTSQVMPALFGVAGPEQIAAGYRAARRYLSNPRTGGLRLCTDFRELKLDFGRVTAFTYGNKEHGSVWNQQNVMYAFALYARGFVREGYRVFRDVFGLVMDSATSRILPCIPSVFDKDGHGSYCYLTGSATWLLMGLLSGMFGLRGEGGDLRIEPKLLAEQFGRDGTTGVSFTFHGRRLRVRYVNKARLDYGQYAVGRIRVNGRDIAPAPGANSAGVLLERRGLVRLCTRRLNRVDVDLAPAGR